MEKSYKMQQSGSSNSDFFFWSTTFLKPEKKVDLQYKTTIFGQPLFLNQISRTRFLEPDFSNWKNRGRRIKVFLSAFEIHSNCKKKFLHSIDSCKVNPSIGGHANL